MGRPYLFVSLLSLVLVACGGLGPAHRRAPQGEAIHLQTQARLTEDDKRNREAAKLYDRACTADPNALDLWLSASRAHGRLGHWNVAVERGRKAVDLAPTDVEANLVLGHALLSVGNLTEAYDLFSKLKESRPDSPDAWASLSAVTLAQGDLKLSGDLLEQALILAPKRAEYWTELGRILERQNRLGDAAAAYDQAIEHDAERKMLNGRVLNLALRAANIEVAKRALRRLVGVGDKEKRITLLLADLLMRNQHYETAHAELAEFIKSDGNNPHANLLLAQSLLHLGRDQDALVPLDKIQPEHEEWSQAQRLKGHVLMYGNGQGDAVQALTRARSARPNSPDLVLELNRALQLDGQMARARSELLLAAAQWPGDARFQFALGLLVHRMEGEDAGLEAMEAVLKIDSDHAMALNYVGFTLAERGERLDEAEAMIRRALSKRPRDGAIVDSLGWVLFRVGRLTESEKTLRQALLLSPQEAEIHFHLAMVLRSQGREMQALRAYERALKLAQSDEERQRYETRFGGGVL